MLPYIPFLFASMAGGFALASLIDDARRLPAIVRDLQRQLERL